LGLSGLGEQVTTGAAIIGWRVIAVFCSARTLAAEPVGSGSEATLSMQPCLRDTQRMEIRKRLR